MIERTVISVDGPSGSGKTTFVEHLLRAADRWIQAVRCHREPDLDEPSREPSERWELTEPYRGIENAQLVVINIRGTAERRRGEAASSWTSSRGDDTEPAARGHFGLQSNTESRRGRRRGG